MDVSLWITVAVGVAALLGYAGRGLRRLWRVLLLIRDLTEVVHTRSEELTARRGDSVRDRVVAIDQWRQSVDSTIAEYGARLSALERRRRL